MGGVFGMTYAPQFGDKKKKKVCVCVQEEREMRGLR